MIIELLNPAADFAAPRQPLRNQEGDTKRPSAYGCVRYTGSLIESYANA
jgi:hypothetical protein